MDGDDQVLVIGQGEPLGLALAAVARPQLSIIPFAGKTVGAFVPIQR